MSQYAEWRRKLKIVIQRVLGRRREFEQGSGMPLDEMVYGLRRPISQEFRDVPPRQKYPSVGLVELSDGLELELKVYVDDVRLSRFNRLSATDKQLRREVWHLLHDLAPPIPLAKRMYDICLLGGEPSARGS